MFKCSKCSKEFKTKKQLDGHFSSHNRGLRYKELRQTNRSKLINERKEKGHFCQYCNITFESGQSLGSHVRMCKQNPEYTTRINKIKKSRANYKSNIETNAKISNTIRKKVKNNEWHTSICNTRRYEYRNEILHGTWELRYAKYLDANNVKWTRPKNGYPYRYQNKIRYYIPDFYLPESDTYIEIKGYEVEKDMYKWNDFPHTLIILREDDLKKLNIFADEA